MLLHRLGLNIFSQGEGVGPIFHKFFLLNLARDRIQMCILKQAMKLGAKYNNEL